MKRPLAGGASGEKIHSAPNGFDPDEFNQGGGSVNDNGRGMEEAEGEHRIDIPRMEGIVREILEIVGETPERDGLLRTPQRVARAWDFLTSGYAMDIEDVLNGAIFEERYDEMVIVKDIDFYSLCEHHALPFFGKAYVAYIPNGKIVGLSKIPRIVDVFARRLQVQERMTQQIAETIDHYLQPQGVAVVTEASHMCMMMRGVQKQNSVTTASAMLGAFKNQVETRAEFMTLITGKLH